jgi:hypothetical protein
LGHDPTISAAVLLADTPTWAGIQGRVVLGWIARAEGKNDDALQSLATLKEFEKGEDARAQLLRKDRPMTKGSSVAGAEPTSRRLNKRGASALSSFQAARDVN